MRIKALSLLLVTLFALWPTQPEAGLVTRPTKTCGTTTYVAEVAAGCTTIKASEVDGDLNAIITGGVNNIETANINAAGLGTAAFADSSVTSAKIADGTIVNADINTSAAIAGTKLAVNATQNNFTTQAANLSVSVTNTTAFWVAASPSITTRGGRVVILTNISGEVVGAASAAITVRVRRDATTPTNGTEIARADYVFNTGATERIPIPSLSWVDSPTAGAHTYSITVQIDANGTFVTSATNAGTMIVVELT